LHGFFWKQLLVTFYYRSLNTTYFLKKKF
jgi:hypothetical protein